MTFPLPSFCPSGVSALTSVSLFASANSAAATLTFPAGIIAGDVLVLHDLAVNTSGAPANVTPTGFTPALGGVLGTTRSNVFVRLANGTESGNLTGMDGTSLDRKLLAVLRGNRSIVTTSPPLDGEAIITAGNPAGFVPTSSLGTYPTLVIACYAVSAAGPIDPRTFTVGGQPAKDGEVSDAGGTMWIAWKLFPIGATPADCTVDMEDETTGNNSLGSFFLNLT
jgi:hypothetical protein